MTAVGIIVTCEWEHILIKYRQLSCKNVQSKVWFARTIYHTSRGFCAYVVVRACNRTPLLKGLHSIQFAIFKPLSYCFGETIGFDVKASFPSRPISRLISWYNNQVIQQKNFNKRLFSSMGLFMDWKLQIELYFCNYIFIYSIIFSIALKNKIERSSPTISKIDFFSGAI